MSRISPGLIPRGMELAITACSYLADMMSIGPVSSEQMSNRQGIEASICAFGLGTNVIGVSAGKIITARWSATKKPGRVKR
jgi:hypothetical protein